MQFQKNTSIGGSRAIIGIVIKIFLVVLLFFIVVTLLNKIDFPSPNKKIEKNISNENFKVVK